MQTADAMITNGMRDLGYSYINIDDFWQLPERGADGHLQIDKNKFPRGIKYVADYLHERGFKLGIYSDAAEKTCGGVCGSYGYEETDAKDLLSAGKCIFWGLYAVLSQRQVLSPVYYTG